MCRFLLGTRHTSLSSNVAVIAVAMEAALNEFQAVFLCLTLMYCFLFLVRQMDPYIGQQTESGEIISSGAAVLLRSNRNEKVVLTCRQIGHTHLTTEICYVATWHLFVNNAVYHLLSYQPYWNSHVVTTSYI